MLSHIHRFSVFMWTGANDSNTLRVDAYFLKKKTGEKNLRSQNYPDTCERGLTSMKRSVEALRKEKNKQNRSPSYESKAIQQNNSASFVYITCS